MSFIPDIRFPTIISLYPNTKEGKAINGKENPYFQGYLDDEDALYLSGYDWVVEEIFKSFFYNLDIYADVLDDCGFGEKQFDKFDDVFDDFVKADTTDTLYDIDSVKDAKVKLLLTLYRAFQDWAETCRDELGVGMIEDMDKDHYEECVEKYKAGYKNAVLKQEEFLNEW